MIHRVKERLDVTVGHIGPVVPPQQMVDLLDRIMAASLGSETSRDLLEQRLVEGVQDHGCCHLPSESALVSPASACKPLSESCLPDPADWPADSLRSDTC